MVDRVVESGLNELNQARIAEIEYSDRLPGVARQPEAIGIGPPLSRYADSPLRNVLRQLAHDDNLPG